MGHHAYLIIGNTEAGIACARRLHDLPETTEADPDVQVLLHDAFGIDEARALKEWAYQTPVSRNTRSFIIACMSMTGEAQNALLKLFEEPPPSSRFALIMAHEEQVLPTLRSRCARMYVGAGGEDHGLATSFLHQSYALRLEEIAARVKAKDIAWQRELLSSLEEYLHARTEYALLAEVAWVERTIMLRGSSPKMLLEHLALTLPIR